MDQRIILITGANRGLGEAAARGLAAMGHVVLVGARDGAAAAAVAASIVRDGGDARPLTIDVADPGSVARAVESAGLVAGRLDSLINNAGVFLDPDRKPEAVTNEQLIQTLTINAAAPVALTNACLPLLRAAAAPRVVMVSSTLGSLGDASNGGGGRTGLAYKMSKAALNMASIGLAKTLGPRIKVNACCPGWCRTSMGGPGAPRSPGEGIRIILHLATLPEDGPTGGFYREDGPIPW
jgi:NAD(P)-dependent dehydrogenase (short-subunit alcohol dehydrogenase family)